MYDVAIMGLKTKICVQCGKRTRIGRTKKRCKACRRANWPAQQAASRNDLTIRIEDYVCGCHHNHGSPEAHKWFWDKAYGKRKKKLAKNQKPVKAKPTPVQREQRRFKRPIYREYIVSAEWKARRDRYMDKKGHKCEVCRGVATQVHHKSYKNLGREKDSDLQALCDGCHRNTHEGQNKPLYDPMTKEFVSLVRGF